MKTKIVHLFSAFKILLFIISVSIVFTLSGCSEAEVKKEDGLSQIDDITSEETESPIKHSQLVIPASNVAAPDDEAAEEETIQETDDTELQVEIPFNESKIESNDISTEELAEENSQEEGRENKIDVEGKEETPEVHPSWLDLYASVFENIQAIDGADKESFDLSKDTYDLLYNEFDYSGTYIYAYKLLDVDGNDIPELIIGNADRTDEFSCDIVYVMFTLADNKPQPVFYSGARSRKYLSTKGDIYWAGSSGAAWSDYYICEYSGAKVTPVSGCFTSENLDNLETCFYKVTAGDRDTGISEEITPEEFNEIYESLEASIIPLTDLIKIE